MSSNTTLPSTRRGSRMGTFVTRGGCGRAQGPVGVAPWSARPARYAPLPTRSRDRRTEIWSFAEPPATRPSRLSWITGAERGRELFGWKARRGAERLLHVHPGGRPSLGRSRLRPVPAARDTSPCTRRPTTCRPPSTRPRASVVAGGDATDRADGGNHLCLPSRAIWTTRRCGTRTSRRSTGGRQRRRPSGPGSSSPRACWAAVSPTPTRSSSSCPVAGFGWPPPGGPFPMETTYACEDAPRGATTMTLRNRGEPSAFFRIAAALLARLRELLERGVR
jgi:hypothetical protein